jgi:hypothetical protein
MVPMGRPRYDPEAIAMNRIIAVLASLEDAACGRVVRHLAERYAVADSIAGATVRATWQVPPGEPEPEYQFTCPHGLSLDVKCGQCTGTMTATPIYEGAPPGDAEP